MKRLFSAVFVLLVIGAIAAPAFADGSAPGVDLGGYIAQSSAIAFSIQPVLPAFVSTGDVPFELTAALSTANIKSGGRTPLAGMIHALIRRWLRERKLDLVAEGDALLRLVLSGVTKRGRHGAARR